MDPKEEIKDWLQRVVCGLSAYPDDVRLEVKTDEMGVLYTLGINKADMGRVIGKKGATANAVRLLLTCAGMARNIRASLKILDI